MWGRLKSWFGSGRAGGPKLPDCPWIEAADNPWGVRAIDVRPVTLGMVSASSDPQMATNLASWSIERGLELARSSERPTGPTRPCALRFPHAGVVPEGAVLLPREMEDKWAVFVSGREVLFFRSWTLQLHVVARFELADRDLTIVETVGVFTDPDEGDLTARIAAFLLWTALGRPLPAPISAALEAEPSKAGVACMNRFGRAALAATSAEVPLTDPPPLRTTTRLHLAAARGDIAGIDAALASGVPIDALEVYGTQPLGLAVRGPVEVVDHLLVRGAQIDGRGSDGHTALMLCAQGGSLEMLQVLLARGASVDAADHRGFTALHRAAETGRADLVEALLAAGATADLEANDPTPFTAALLADLRGHAELAARLRGVR